MIDDRSAIERLSLFLNRLTDIVGPTGRSVCAIIQLSYECIIVAFIYGVL